jgi:hypothetical protein
MACFRLIREPIRRAPQSISEQVDRDSEDGSQSMVVGGDFNVSFDDSGCDRGRHILIPRWSGKDVVGWTGIVALERLWADSWCQSRLSPKRPQSLRYATDQPHGPFVGNVFDALQVEQALR